MKAARLVKFVDVNYAFSDHYLPTLSAEIITK